MVETEPRKQQALGRQVKNFSKRVWEANKERIVEEGNWNKFSNPKEEADLGEKLIETGERELVEVCETPTVGVEYQQEISWWLICQCSRLRHRIGFGESGLMPKTQKRIDISGDRTCSVRP